MKKQKTLVLKFDQVKSYDRVNWGFLRLALLQIGLSLEARNWIMGCVNSTFFLVLVTGEPIDFFKISWGFRKGCPLSSLLFLLIVEGLSRIITKAKREGTLEGINLSLIMKITHLLFVDDVILFGKGTLVEWQVYKAILDTFYKAFGMLISENKYTFLEFGMEEEVLV